MRPVARIVLALVAASLGGGSARAAPLGRVRFVTARRAYFMAGRLDGLELGALVPLSRNGRLIEACKVDQLGDHEGSCASTKARAGDTFPFPAPEPRPPEAPPLSPPTDDELVRAAVALETAPVEKIDYAGGIRKVQRGGGALFSGSLGHDAYVTLGGSDFQQERIDLQLNGVGIRWAGFRAFAHLTAIIASVRPTEQRFRPGDVAQIYLWEAAFSSREVGRPFTLSVGRIWPYHTPGLAMLDGAQVGWRRKDGLAEAGVYGGLVPDATTLYPAGQRYAAGAYYGHTLLRTQAGRTPLILSTEGRLGLRGAPTPGAQLELEWAMLATVGRRFDMGLQARGSIGAGDWTHPAFESARLTLTARPIDALRLIGSFRYLDPKADYDDFAVGFFETRRTLHGNLDLTWDPRPWISVSVMSGVDSAIGDQSSTRGSVGPELGFPRLFHGQGGIAVGYREEIGWFAGRNVYLQATGTAGNRVRAVGRFSYFEDRPSGVTSDAPYREIGFYAYVEGRLLRWLSARLTSIGRLNVDRSGEGLPPPGGFTLRAELIGSL